MTLGSSTDARSPRRRLAGPALRLGCAATSTALVVASALVAASPEVEQRIPASPISWGNAIYADLAVGQSCEFLGRQVRLVAVQGDHCTIEVDGVGARLRMARLRLHAFSDTVGYGWLLGDWCAGGNVEYLRNHQPGQSARLSKIMHTESGAPAVNPDGWIDFEVAVGNGRYRVEAEVGDAYADTWQRIAFEGVDAGAYELAAGQLQWTPPRIVGVQDGRLTVRIHLKDDTAKAGLRNLNFAKVEQSGVRRSKLRRCRHSIPRCRRCDLRDPFPLRDHVLRTSTMTARLCTTRVSATRPSTTTG